MGTFLMPNAPRGSIKGRFPVLFLTLPIQLNKNSSACSTTGTTSGDSGLPCWPLHVAFHALLHASEVVTLRVADILPCNGEVPKHYSHSVNPRVDTVWDALKRSLSIEAQLCSSWLLRFASVVLMNRTLIELATLQQAQRPWLAGLPASLRMHGREYLR
eukprot:2850131-Amphidinium_carterae.1